MSSLFYFFKESLQGFARNLSTTLGSIITIFLSLLIIGVFLVGGTIVERLVSSIEDEVSSPPTWPTMRHRSPSTPSPR